MKKKNAKRNQAKTKRETEGKIILIEDYQEQPFLHPIVRWGLRLIFISIMLMFLYSICAYGISEQGMVMLVISIVLVMLSFHILK